MRKYNGHFLIHSTHPRRALRGFTIVELLIVIVVIAILAAITIVAYNGITNRAKQNTAMADINNVFKQLKVYQVTNSAYPVANDCTATPVASSVCFEAASGSSYQYTVDNGASPQTFCVTIWNGTTNYYVTENNSKPTAGVCSGHGVAGAPAVNVITNLAVNPALGTNATNWGSGGTFSTSPSRTAIGDLAGFAYAYSGTPSANGSRVCASGATVVSGTPYAVTMWVKGPAGTTTMYQAATTAGSLYTGPTSIGTTTGSWQKVQFTFTPSDTTATICYRFQASSGYGPISMTGVMLVAGSTYYNYADGNSSNWSWSGTTNNSTSSGPDTGL